MLSLIFILLMHVHSAVPLLSDSSFQIQIKPQLLSIETEFLEILELFPNYPKKNLIIWKQAQDLRAIARRWRLFAPQKPGISHLKNLQALKVSLDRFQALMDADHEPMLELTKDLIKKIETTLEGISENQPDDITTGLALSGHLDDLASLSNVLIAEGVPSAYKEMFRRVLDDFIIPLASHVRRENQSIYLTTNLYQLNFTWNELNQIVAKRTTDLPNTMKQYFNLIQNRWNQVMKVCQKL